MKNKVLFIAGGLLIICAGAILIAISAFSQAGNKADKTALREGQAQTAGSDDVILPDLEKLPELAQVPPIEESEHVQGAIDAPVRIIVYSDFACPFCGDFYSIVKEVREEFGNQAIIAFRHFPLQSHLNAFPAALASECADEQGKFWEMHDRLFEAGRTGNLDDDTYFQAAAAIGLEAEKFKECFVSKKYKDKIIDSVVRAKQAGVVGTPTIFIGDEVLPGAYPMDDFTGSDGQNQEGLRSIITRHLTGE